MENNQFRKFHIKYHTCYCLHDIIELQDFDTDNVLINKKSHENI